MCIYTIENLKPAVWSQAGSAGRAQRTKQMRLTGKSEAGFWDSFPQSSSGMQISSDAKTLSAGREEWGGSLAKAWPAACGFMFQVRGAELGGTVHCACACDKDVYQEELDQSFLRLWAWN